jgi:hypothetical protein
MFMFSAFSPTHNPILRAELYHYQRGQTKRRWRWWHIPWQLLTLISNLSVIVALIAALVSFEIDATQELLTTILSIVLLAPGFVLIPVTIVMHFRLILQTLTVASDSIAREKRSGTWDIMLLTGIDSRRLILGKWWAILRSLARPYAYLAFLRVGTIIYITLVSNRITYYQSFGLIPHYQPLNVLTDFLAPILLIALMTFVNAGFTSAIGVYTSLLSKRGSVGMAVAVAIRVGVLVPTAIIIAWMSWQYSYSLYSYDTMTDYYSSPAWYISQIGGGMAVTLLDNGATMIGSMAGSSEANTKFFNFLSVCLGLTFYGLVGGAMLFVAQMIAVRQYVLKPDSRKTRTREAHE